MNFSKLLKLIAKNAFFAGLLLLMTLVGCKNANENTTDPSVSKNSKNGFSLGSKKAISKILSPTKAEEFFFSDSLQNFYAERDYAPVWSNTDLRETFIESLKQSEAEGLYFKDYHGEEIEGLEGSLNTKTEAEKSAYDILLTDAYFKFSTHLLNGKTDPKKIHEIFDLPKNQANLSQLLKSGISKGSLEDVFNELRPTHPIYNQLINSLAYFKEKMKKSDEFKEIASGEMIKPGMKDERVPKIAFRLMILGYLEEVDPFSYEYEESIENAVKQLQLENGLLADGIIGNSSIQLLNIDYKDRYQQVLANLERWRWYPRDLGAHYILVNIANYNLDVFKDNKLVKSHKTMVGTNSRKTPIFSDEIKYIVFNPNWTIPPTIKTKDVIPGARKDTDYLSKKNIDVYNTKGELLNPVEINWNNDPVSSYTYRQKPGSSNPLGRVKIIYPNKHLIYLHDTPSKSLFSRNSRAQSSGCVRVEGALDLATFLLNDQPAYSSEAINELLEKAETTQVKMQQRVKVYHLYWTAWTENKKPIFTEDIYNYDEKIIEELEKVSTP